MEQPAEFCFFFLGGSQLSGNQFQFCSILFLACLISAQFGIGNVPDPSEHQTVPRRGRNAEWHWQ